MMIYKNFKGTIEYSHEDCCFYGQLCDIDGLVLYEGENLEELQNAFEIAVDDYLILCEEFRKNT